MTEIISFNYVALISLTYNRVNGVPIKPILP